MAGRGRRGEKKEEKNSFVSVELVKRLPLLYSYLVSGVREMRSYLLINAVERQGGQNVQFEEEEKF